MACRVESAVIGRDGTIGAALFAELGRRGGTVVGTSRRALPAHRGGHDFRLDLSASPITGLDALECDIAYLCAAVTGFANCSDDPTGTARINVTGALAVARSLMARGTHVVLLSTSAVFDGSKPLPGENSPGSPTTEYGRQKLLAERELLSAAAAMGGSAAVIRLTKVVSRFQPLINNFKTALASGSAVEAFDDLSMSPISLDYATRSILQLGNLRHTGIFHLSGTEQLSYAQWVRRLAIAIDADPSLVRAVRATDRGVNPPFAPRFAALGMARTIDIGGIHPQNTDAAIADLLRESV